MSVFAILGIGLLFVLIWTLKKPQKKEMTAAERLAYEQELGRQAAQREMEERW